MPKFRKKPVVIEAFQWQGELVAGFNVEESMELSNNKIITVRKLKIPTLEGTMSASIGDWIITGVVGEKYPCKNDVFKATYDPVV